MLLPVLLDQTAIAPLAHAAGTVVSAVPNPGGGTAPPGSDKIVLILRWAAWIVSAACVLGVLFCAGSMALAHQGRGGGHDHTARLGWVLGGCILVGMASGLVGALI